MNFGGFSQTASSLAKALFSSLIYSHPAKAGCYSNKIL